MLDIAGYRAKKRAELTEQGAKAAAEVKSSGEPVKMNPMTPFERRSCTTRSRPPACAASPRARSRSASSSCFLPERHVALRPRLFAGGADLYQPVSQPPQCGSAVRKDGPRDGGSRTPLRASPDGVGERFPDAVRYAELR